MNTMYRQSKNRLTAWISPDRLTKNQSDYILVPIDQKGLIEICKVFNSADIRSDHSLLMGKHITVLPNVKYFSRQPKIYHVSKLKPQPTLDAFKVQLRGKLKPLINDLADQSVAECCNKCVDDTNETSENMIGSWRNTVIDSLSQETKICVEKEEHLGKKFLILKELINLQLRNT